MALADAGAYALMQGIAPLLAPVIRYMAKTGAGTDACLRGGCLPVPVHFYSPIPAIDDLRSRDVWRRRSALSGIALREPEQLSLLAELGREFGAECRWPHADPGDRWAFFTDNAGFSFGCAAATHSLIRRFKPQQVIEIGSGSSSRVIAAALRRNAADISRGAASYTIVDPYPAPELPQLPGLTSLRRERVEETPIEWFDALDANDILFVDSGHTVRIGGDVNFLILDVLPRLKPGVIVHLHDIPMPYEYGEIYATNPRFRMFWTESYLLQAFLCFNQAFEVLLAMNLIMRDHLPAFAQAFVHHDAVQHRDLSHSFWIRRRE
jgi:hypothetical protein